MLFHLLPHRDLIPLSAPYTETDLERSVIFDSRTLITTAVFLNMLPMLFASTTVHNTNSTLVDGNIDCILILNHSGPMSIATENLPVLLKSPPVVLRLRMVLLTSVPYLLSISLEIFLLLLVDAFTAQSVSFI